MLTVLTNRNGDVALLMVIAWVINRLTPNDPDMGRTTPLTSKRSIFIYLFNKYRY